MLIFLEKEFWVKLVLIPNFFQNQLRLKILILKMNNILNEQERGGERERGGTDRLYLTMCPLLWLVLHRWHPASWLGHVWTFRGQCSSGLPPESWNSEQTGPWHRLWKGQSAAGKMEAPHWKLKKKLKSRIVLNEHIRVYVH